MRKLIGERTRNSVVEGRGERCFKVHFMALESQFMLMSILDFLAKWEVLFALLQVVGWWSYHHLGEHHGGR